MNQNEINHNESEEVQEQSNPIQWLLAEARKIVNRVRYYDMVKTSAEGKLCAIHGKHAAVRLSDGRRPFAAVEVSNFAELPKVGSKIKIIDGVVQAQPKASDIRPNPRSGYTNRFTVSRNRAVLAKALELGSDIKGQWSSFENGERKDGDADEMGAGRIIDMMESKAKTERAHGSKVALDFKFTSSTNQWHINSFPGHLTFTAPSPQEVCDILNAQKSCEKESRALARMGRRFKQEPIEPPRRAARL